MNNQQTAWKLLTEAIGSYQGEGVNHEKQNFTSKLKLEYGFEKKLLGLSSSATGKTGEVYHHELSWIGNDLMGSLTLYVNSNNHPGVTPHKFDRIENGAEGESRIIFRFGNVEDRNSFREEISVALFRDKTLEHFYSWGLPGGEFQKRSGSRMAKI